MSTPHPQHPAALGRMMLFTALVMLALLVLAKILTLPGDVGPEDFLGLGPRKLAELHAIADTWRALTIVSRRGWCSTLESVAVTYLSLDTILFIPLYGALFFEIARRLPRLPARILTVATFTLMSVDLIENTSGLAKVAALSTGIGWTAVVAGVVAPALGFWFWKTQTPGETILRGLSARHWPNADARWRYVLVAVLVVAAVPLVASRVHDFAGFVISVSAVSHRAKKWLLVAMLVVLATLGVYWLFRPGTPKSDLGALRRGLADILLRTRYVILILAVLVGLTLVLNQTRDVVIGVADGLFEPSRGALGAWLTLLFTVLAIWALSFSCWLWARLACRMQGPTPMFPATLPPAINATLQMAARGTARTLGLVPLFVTAYVSGLAARDAVWAATISHGESIGAQASQAPAAIETPLLLLAFGGFSLLGGMAFLRNRERLGGSAIQDGLAKDYYDDPSLGANWMSQIAAEKYHFLWRNGPGPTLLSILALIVAVGARCLSVLAEVGVSLTYVVINLMLVAWLGFLGWLSLKERREARPWVLAIIVVVGLVGFLGFAENHVVRVTRAGVSAALPGAGAQVIGTILLAIVVVGAAVVLVRNAIRAQDGKPVSLRWGWVLLIAFGAGVLVLLGVDCRTHSDPDPAGIASRLTLDEAFDRWTKGLKGDSAAAKSGDREVFFVTSEGGGMRAAYWTARVLQQLSHRDPTFNARTFMLSGVSGGAVGEAVYVACSRHGEDAYAGGVASCIDHFGSSDILTPLVGAWLFEDALARVLPTSLPSWLNKQHTFCRQPGCGFLSRGLWFEQGLERAVPALKTGIAQTAKEEGEQLPQLFLNSTWVESGERTVASGVRVDWKTYFPAARDQLTYAARDRAKRDAPVVDLPLSTAAHNAGRFPYANALGILRRADAKDSGHLADGGYYDNLGGNTTLDVLAAFRGWVANKCPPPRTEKPASDKPPPDGPASAQDDPCPWLRSLELTVLVVQNGVPVDCRKGKESDPDLPCLRRLWKLDGPPEQPDEYKPGKPTGTSLLKLYADVLGPPVTVVNVSGLSAASRRAVALLREECRRSDVNQCRVIQVAQRTDGALAPLGWYLSPTARAALDAKACDELKRQLPLPGGNTCSH